jgi:tetraacyldisaccharide 4'-kinase
LSALGGLYGRVTQLRRAWYGRHPERRRRLNIPVISVGNLVVGGSGKTPIVAALARLLQDAGERPAILSRGYGRRGTTDDVVVVSDRQRVIAAVEASGDEPQMLARALPGLPVLVCADRFRAGRVAEERYDATVALLDDGFQHLPLARTVDLLVVSPADLGERLLPSGRLREPLRTASLADAVLVPGDVRDADRIAAALGVRQLFRVQIEFGAPRLVRPFGAELDAGTRRDAIAVAAIARPERFFDVAAREGWTVRERMIFRDHHWFTRHDVGKASAAARDAAVDIVLTTEKDAVRLEGLIPDEGPTWAYLPMRVSVEPRAAFRDWILARVRQERSAG